MKIRSRLARAAALTMLAVTGAAIGAGTWTAVANAWNIDNLPNGYSEVRIHLADPACIDLQISYGTAGITDIGSTCDPGFQSNLDAYVNATICTVNPAAGQAEGMCLPPATTTTDTAVTTDTTAAPAVTTTATPAVTTTATPAVTTTAVVTDPATATTTDTTSIESRLATLEAEYAALSQRVDAIAQANTASWDAFISTVNSGGTVADAALAARSAGLNAIYQLA